MNKETITALLPWYINNTLNEEETKIIAEALKNDTELKKEHAFLHALSVGIKANEAPSPGEIGLARFKRSIKTPNNKKNKATNAWKLTTIAASLIIVVQTGFALKPTDNQSLYEPLGSNSKNNTIVATFSATATEQQIRNALLDSDAVIIDGPSAAGVYRLHSTTELNTTIKLLQNHPKIITHIQVE